MDLQLKGKNALVFGSTGGIGKAVAQSLIAEGAEVFINGRTEEKCAKVSEEIGAAGFYAGDLTETTTAALLTKKMINDHNKLDILVTNTGGPKKGDFLDVTIEQWRTDYQSLWLSVVESLHEALPAMRKNGFGRVLLVTSLAAKEPLPGLTTSNGLRAGLAGLVRSMANEFSKDGVTFNLLLPGYTNTDRIKALNLSEDKIKEMVPAGRLGEPEELADLASFLASPRAGYITGQSIAIDGGVLKGH
ncbi:MAG: SDR family oxidoreductase [Halobacteriovoraceae bacterium]|jgi:3-oxoacyl-[acyl-carrier protein] reductase|nr:SDR family oxidoreductase [Halobacteriovoraceae bacterium]